MKKIPIAQLIFTISVLAGCSSTGVIPMDRDSYMIGKKDGMPGLGISLSNKADVYKEANEYCSNKGLEVQTLRVTTSPAKPGVLGYTELHFKCTPSGLTAQPLIPDPSSVIEIRNK